LIEVQNGEYLGEDDIIRFEDDYARSKPATKWILRALDPSLKKL
jgi:hypothetical protein